MSLKTNKSLGDIHAVTIICLLFTCMQVIEFLPNAVAKDRRDWVSPQSLGIHPRDLSIFQTGSRMAIQRATITARDGTIFIKTGAVSM
jgi:hypothetical protein